MEEVRDNLDLLTQRVEQLTKSVERATKRIDSAEAGAKAAEEAARAVQVGGCGVVLAQRASKWRLRGGAGGDAKGEGSSGVMLTG